MNETSTIQRTARRRAPNAPAAAAAVVVATARSETGGPAALLPWEGGTILGRLLGQLESLGIGEVHVVTRPAWEAEVGAALEAAAPAGVRLQLSEDVADDLRVIAELARADDETTLFAMYGDMVTHREALAGLLADPRISSGVLSTGGRAGRPFAMRLKNRRGRVISAQSAYHYCYKPSGSFLGVLKVAGPERETLARQSERLAELVVDPPDGWRTELSYKRIRWRHALARMVLGQEERTAPDGADQPPPVDPQQIDLFTLEQVELPPEMEADLERRLVAAGEDAVALSLVGLVRAGVHLNNSYLRTLFWARPLSAADAARAERDILDYDEDKELLDSAVKGSDGFFTTFFVSPYSRYIARWCAHRGFSPNQITVASLLVGVLAAAAMATGQRWGLIAGAVLLQAAFTLDCVDGQTARYTRQFSKLGAWLDSVFDRTKEYLVFAGLAIGASRAGDPVWALAGAALALQTMRHAIDFSFAASAHAAIAAAIPPPVEETGDGFAVPVDPTAAAVAERAAARERQAKAAAARAPVTTAEAVEVAPPPTLAQRVLSLWRKLDRVGALVWIKRIAVFPIGERFAAISITAAIWNPRVTFTVLLAWGAFAALYGITGRLLRTVVGR
jgi:phosphatidylglycerophosphate synthase/CTP:molybdopterin cytidylyltransferase MocA